MSLWCLAQRYRVKLPVHNILDVRNIKEIPGFVPRASPWDFGGRVVRLRSNACRDARPCVPTLRFKNLSRQAGFVVDNNPVMVHAAGEGAGVDSEAVVSG